VEKARNDLSAAVPKFCLALEEHRRTPDGRVRTSQELLTTFFPHDDKACTDRILKYLPNEVRGPIIAAWGIRGIKSALRDNDEKVQSVLYDALLAGDVDHAGFEEGVTAETLVRWVPLGDLWTFWRGGKLTKQAIHKALSTAYELFLFDARWFLETVTAKGGSLKGTDVLADGLTKDDLTQWVRRIHETGDGSPKGVVAALGWDKIVSKTQNDVLIAALDAVAVKVGLVAGPAKESSPRVTDSKPEAKAGDPAHAAEPPAARPSLSSSPSFGARPSTPDATALTSAAAKPADTPKASEEPAAISSEEPASWSEPPPASAGEVTVAAGAEDLITVVVEEEAGSSPGVVTSASATPAAAGLPTNLPKVGTKSTYDEDETTVIKPMSRSQHPPANRGGPGRR
jgi:hypothetical protein